MVDYKTVQAYQSALAQARIMLEKGIINKDDIVSTENSLAEKYGLKYGSIYREIDLLNVSFRSNME